MLKNNDLNFVVANLIHGFNTNENEIWVFDKKGKSVYKKGKKEDLADFILDMIK